MMSQYIAWIEFLVFCFVYFHQSKACACFSQCSPTWLLLMHFNPMFRRKKCDGMLREFKKAKEFFGVGGTLSSKKRKRKEDVTPRVATQQPSSGCDPVTGAAHCLNTHCPWFLSISAWNIRSNKAFLTLMFFFSAKKSTLKFTLMFFLFLPWPEGCCRFLLSSLSCSGWHRV